MDRRRQRSLNTIKRIKQAALELFSAHGVDKVSMDEIAARAKVSKVTIYKHFGSKDELYADVLNLFIDETLAASEAILNSKQDFLDKLKALLRLQFDSTTLVSFARLYELWEANPPGAQNANERLQAQVKALIYRFYEEGQRQGYIDENIPFDLLYLYADIFRAGFQARAMDLESALVDAATLEALYDLYFFGFIKRK